MKVPLELAAILDSSGGYSATVMARPTVTEMHENRNSDLGINAMHFS